MRQAPLILYIHHNSQHIGGADYCLLKMVKAVQDSREYRCMVLLRHPSKIIDLYRDAGITVVVRRLYRPDRKSPLLLLLPFFALHEILFIRRLIKQHPIDLIHSNDLFDYIGNIAAKWCGLPSVQSVRTILNLRKPYNKLISRLCCLSADRLLCVSENVRRTMFPQCPDKTAVVYDWVDFSAVKHDAGAASLREKSGLAPDAVLIGCVGRMVPRKGQDVFLQAAETVAQKRRGVYFLLIGNAQPGSAYEQTLRRQWASSLYNNRIIFLPHRSDMHSVMSQLDIVVNSSTYPDPFPGVVLEAMTCGKPVIGADEGGMPEQIIDGVTGFLFRARDAGDLAGKMELTLDALANRKLHPDRIKEHVQYHFNREKSLDALMAAYRSLLDPSA
ncbi:glycosyltransferase family 4 protein [candidate division KSB1 bacterium]|nr:glycosyltransferase family 4 protein [candidate division KSB1 bacterium]